MYKKVIYQKIWAKYMIRHITEEELNNNEKI